MSFKAKTDLIAQYSELMCEKYKGISDEGMIWTALFNIFSEIGWKQCHNIISNLIQKEMDESILS